MRPAHAFAFLLALAFPAAAQAQTCEQAIDTAWGGKRGDAAFAAARRRYPTGEITVEVPASPERVTAALLGELARCHFPVVSNTGGVIHARFSKETGWFGNYELSAFAYVLPALAGGSTVRLYAEENAARGSAFNPRSSNHNVGPENVGRSGQVWWTLQRIGYALTVDSTLRAVAVAAADSTPPAFVGSASRKVYMTAGCSLAPQLDAFDKVVFRSESEAKAAGYARSGAPGC